MENNGRTQATEDRMRISTLFLLSSFLSIVFLISALSTPLYAADPEKQLSTIEESLKKRKRQVQETIKQEKSILSELESINKTIKNIQAELRKYKNRISNTQAQIKNLEEEIALLAKRMEQRRQKLKERLKVLYKQQYGDKALILITAGDYQDLIKKSRYMSILTYQDQKLINTFNSEMNEANAKKRDLEILNKNLEISKANVEKKNNEIKLELNKKDNLLASVRGKRSSYEKMIRELEESSEKIREMIKRLEKEKPEEVFTGKGFRSLKGRLSWPVEGEVVIPFGKYHDTNYKITLFKNGIEVKADEGEEPTAVSDGSVVYADWFKGYGLLLILNHGSGYHTLYGNMAEIFHKSGDIIKQGTVVGKIGQSGLLNIPTLYFEIRYKGKPVDPMQWLKRTSNRNKR